MGLSVSKNISCFEFPTFSSRCRAGYATTVTPLSTGENNSTGASRYRVISLSCFVHSRTRFRRFTVKRISATGDKIEKKSIARAAIARGRRHPWRRMKMMHIGFLRDESLSWAAFLLGGTLSFNDWTIHRGKYSLYMQAKSKVSEFRD